MKKACARFLETLQNSISRPVGKERVLRDKNMVRDRVWKLIGERIETRGGKIKELEMRKKRVRRSY